jgi:hypothetical protein
MAACAVMSDLFKRIRAAQVEAGERVVMDDLKAKGLDTVVADCYVCRGDPKMTSFCSRCGGTDLLAELDTLAKVLVFHRDTFSRARAAMAAAHEELSRLRRGEFVCSICLLRKNGELPDEQPF